MRNNKDFNIINAILLMFALGIFLSFCVDMTGETLRRPSYFFCILAVLLVSFVFRKNLPNNAIIWTMLGGVFVKVSYILYTAVWVRQHDVISFGAGEGQAAYIEYILTNKSLPNFDPRLLWGFFQPPLHHFISAVWMWINIRLGIAERQLQESIQVLTLSYMVMLMLMTYLICKELMMKQRGILIAMIITSFHPIFTLLSGSINNDALSISLSAVALYIAIRWYKKPGFLGIILMAICIGLAMMAKLSAGLIAPGIGAMMLYKFFTDKKSRIKYVFEFLVFGIIVFPLGLWWPIRNKLMWGMPVNYIPEVGEQLTHSSIFSRLLDVRMSSVYPAMINNSDAYDEYNVWLAMIKTSLFGESNFGQVSGIINPFAIVLFLCSVIIIILEVAAFVAVIRKKEATPAIEYKILLGVTAISLFGGYLAFALGYNNFSAQDFRYAALMIAIMAIFLGLWDDRLDSVSSLKKNEDVTVKRITLVRKAIFAVSVVFAICSAAVYLLVGLL